MTQSKILLLLFSLFFAGCCGTSTTIQPETRLIPVPDLRKTIPAISVIPRTYLYQDSLVFVPMFRADDDSIHVEFQIQLDSLQNANDSLKAYVLSCQSLYNKLNKRVSVQARLPDIQYTPPPVICPPAEQHGFLWKIGFAFIVLACGAAVIGVVKAVSALRVF